MILEEVLADGTFVPLGPAVAASNVPVRIIDLLSKRSAESLVKSDKSKCSRQPHQIPLLEWHPRVTLDLPRLMIHQRCVSSDGTADDDMTGQSLGDEISVTDMRHAEGARELEADRGFSLVPAKRHREQSLLVVPKQSVSASADELTRTPLRSGVKRRCDEDESEEPWPSLPRPTVLEPLKRMRVGGSCESTGLNLDEWKLDTHQPRSCRLKRRLDESDLENIANNLQKLDLFSAYKMPRLTPVA